MGSFRSGLLGKGVSWLLWLAWDCSGLLGELLLGEPLLLGKLLRESLLLLGESLLLLLGESLLLLGKSLLRKLRLLRKSLLVELLLLLLLLLSFRLRICEGWESQRTEFFLLCEGELDLGSEGETAFELPTNEVSNESLAFSSWDEWWRRRRSGGCWRRSRSSREDNHLLLQRSFKLGFFSHKDNDFFNWFFVILFDYYFFQRFFGNDCNHCLE